MPHSQYFPKVEKRHTHRVVFIFTCQTFCGPTCFSTICTLRCLWKISLSPMMLRIENKQNPINSFVQNIVFQKKMKNKTYLMFYRGQFFAWNIGGILFAIRNSKILAIDMCKIFAYCKTIRQHK